MAKFNFYKYKKNLRLKKLINKLPYDYSYESTLQKVLSLEKRKEKLMILKKP